VKAFLSRHHLSPLFEKELLACWIDGFNYGRVLK